MVDVTRRFENYRPPEKVEPPPVFRWPIRPLQTARWFVAEFLYPWGLFFIGLAVVAWYYLTPDMSRMATVEPGWIALLWLRNAGLLLLVAGGLHWHLHIRKVQDQKFKFDKRWLAKNSRRFLFRDQVKDNMFWSVVSGVTIWTAYEAATLWAYASGTVASTTETVYVPSSRAAKRYRPSAFVVWLANRPSALSTSSTPAMPGSPSSWTPSASISRHTKSPMSVDGSTPTTSTSRTT